jgi:lipid II:glycine glycyltransferase (peptidoglycan interpeptide bridge formation enzyme)
MLELDRKYMGFKSKMIFFADHPYDVDKVDYVYFSHIRKMFDAPGFEREEWRNAIIDLKKGPELLWNNMSNKCRSDIKRSERDGITIHVNENFEEFIKLNSEFRKAKNLPPIFRPYLKPPLPNFCALFTAKHQDEVIVGILFVKDNKEMYGMLGASKRLQVSKNDTALISRANRRLWWEAMRWGSEQGLLTIDMGSFPAKGTDPEQEGVSEFKRRLGAEAVTSYVYSKTYTRKAKIIIKTMATIRRIS